MEVGNGGGGGGIRISLCTMIRPVLMLQSTSQIGTVSKTGFEAPAMKYGLGLTKVSRDPDWAQFGDALTKFQELAYGTSQQTGTLVR
jgi:hypothetical protein